MRPRAKPASNGKVKFHLYLPEEMYLALRREAYLTGTTVNKLVLRQLRRLKVPIKRQLAILRAHVRPPGRRLMNIRCTEEFYRLLRQHSYEQDKSMSSLIEEYVRERIENAQRR